MKYFILELQSSYPNLNINPPSFKYISTSSIVQFRFSVLFSACGVDLFHPPPSIAKLFDERFFTWPRWVRPKRRELAFGSQPLGTALFSSALRIFGIPTGRPTRWCSAQPQGQYEGREITPLTYCVYPSKSEGWETMRIPFWRARSRLYRSRFCKY